MHSSPWQRHESGIVWLWQQWGKMKGLIFTHGTSLYPSNSILDNEFSLHSWTEGRLWNSGMYAQWGENYSMWAKNSLRISEISFRMKPFLVHHMWNWSTAAFCTRYIMWCSITVKPHRCYWCYRSPALCPSLIAAWKLCLAAQTDWNLIQLYGPENPLQSESYAAKHIQRKMEASHEHTGMCAAV